ncbi:MAG: hypothetical protein M0036_22220 [Desulfobacteraceae bacterium]|nr:hypothetical protein [Desulfobacteraceae bacterium]
MRLVESFAQLYQGAILANVHPEIGKFGQDRGALKIESRHRRDIWVVFRGVNFQRNKVIGQLGY